MVIREESDEDDNPTIKQGGEDAYTLQGAPIQS